MTTTELAVYLNPALRISTQSIAWCGNQWWSAQAQAGTGHGRETLTISRMDSAGTLLSSMQLVDSSHGSQIGVEAVDGLRYVWVAWVKPDGIPALARVRHQPGAVLSIDSGGVAISSFLPFTPGIHVDPACTPDGWMATRNVNWDTGEEWFEKRKILDVRAAVDDLYGVVVTPPLYPADPACQYQGHTTQGDVLYRLEGLPTTGMRVGRWSWLDGSFLGYTDVSRAVPREPEGMAVDAAGTVHFGLVAGGGATRYPVFSLTSPDGGS